MDVGYHDVLAAFKRDVPEVVRRSDRAAVAHVILAAHDEPAPGQVAREFVIARDMLGHAVDDLEDAARRNSPRLHLGKLPYQSPDLGLPVR